jgi:hypothetical protein
MHMSDDSLPMGASLDEIKKRIANVQEKALDSHSKEYEEIFQELNRALNEIDGI